MLSALVLAAHDISPDVAFHVHSYYPTDDRDVVTAVPVEVHSARPLDLVLKVIPQSILHRVAPSLWRGLPEGPTKRSVETLAASDVLACVAGVAFHDGRRAVLAYNVATLLPALLLGTPVVKFAQALGRFDDPVNRVVARTTLRRLRAIHPRGSDSESAVRRLLGDRPAAEGPTVAKAADLAFTLTGGRSLVAPSEGVTEALRSWVEGGEGQIVGVSPSAVLAGASPAGSEHLVMMREVVLHLLLRGNRVVVLPSAARPGRASTHNNDLPLIDALRASLPDDERVHWAAGVRNFNDVTEVVRACDALVASRFHSMVAGLSSAVPTLVLGWGHKYAEVLELFGLDQQAMSGQAPADEVSVGNVLQAIDALLDTREQTAELLRARLPDVIAASRTQLRWLLPA